MDIFRRLYGERMAERVFSSCDGCTQFYYQGLVNLLVIIFWSN